jgi:hypothetical protein
MHRCGFNRKCAIRRELNSHKVAMPPSSYVTSRLPAKGAARENPRINSGLNSSAMPQLPTSHELEAQLEAPPLLCAASSLPGFGFRGLSPAVCAATAYQAQPGANRAGRRALAKVRLVPSEGWSEHTLGFQSPAVHQLLGFAVLPNPSLEPTRYGRQRKAGPRPRRHFRSPALRCLPPRAPQLER